MLQFLRNLWPVPQAIRSPDWKELRDSWLDLYPVCAVCGATQHLNVHHVKPVKLFPELELDSDNLITLCESPARNCHLNIGHLGDWRAWNPHVLHHASIVRDWRRQRRYAA